MNIHFLGQIVLQITGFFNAAIKYRDINIDTYVPKTGYALPFDGEWYTGSSSLL